MSLGLRAHRVEKRRYRRILAFLCSGQGHHGCRYIGDFFAQGIVVSGVFELIRRSDKAAARLRA